MTVMSENTHTLGDSKDKKEERLNRDPSLGDESSGQAIEDAVQQNTSFVTVLEEPDADEFEQSDISEENAQTSDTEGDAPILSSVNIPPKSPKMNNTTKFKKIYQSGGAGVKSGGGGTDNQENEADEEKSPKPGI